MIPKFCRIFCLVFLIGDFHSSLSHFDNNRPKLLNSNINNGSIATLDDARHQASIRLVNKDVTFGEGHICSGSLISSRVVLTAGRCLFNSDTKTTRHPAELIVVLGSINRYQRTADTVISRITHIRYPSTFDMETMSDDIGLLFLSHEVPENHSTIRPIELNRKNIDINMMRGRVTGWELSKNGDLSQQLLVSNASIVNQTSCVTKVEGPHIRNGMICAKYNRIEGNLCQSDVGAPLVNAGKQIGLASWTADSCSTQSDHQLASYTDVAHHTKWIRTEMSDGNNTDSSVWGALGFLALSWFAFKDKQKLSFRF
ncbi:trypsin beta-like [Episyrphus balteatus]|uniref:trypsin beta-like n=1 Tax=Episyrphus balteatus TaxID=286459 RepID=UPI002485750E|nr:trypsin beta-like [Episyrphus balteatus]